MTIDLFYSGNDITHEDLWYLLEYSYNSFSESIELGHKTLEYYHNRQFDEAIEQVLKERKQPIQTYNIIKSNVKLLQGYFSDISNDVMVTPESHNSIGKALVLTDVLKYIRKQNKFDKKLRETLNFDFMTVGLACTQLLVTNDPNKQDELGVPYKKLTMERVDPLSLFLDPVSRADDYSDSRFLNRAKWMSLSKIKQVFKLNNEKLEALRSYRQHNFTGNPNLDYSYLFNQQYGLFGTSENSVLIIHTIITDFNNKVWEIFWTNEMILSKKQITNKPIKIPYSIQKLHHSDRTEFYGIFKEVLGNQDAINQAVIKIQNLVNTKRIFITPQAVKKKEDFIAQVNTPGAVVEVSDLSAANFQIDNTTVDINDQYLLIETALERAKAVLGINDSFLGLAKASDSGRKVNIQRQSSVTALTYFSNALHNYYYDLFLKVLNLVKIYFKANQVFSLTEPGSADKFFSINEYFALPWKDNNDKIQRRVQFYTSFKDNEFLSVPLNHNDSAINIAEVDIELNTHTNSDIEEQNRVFTEQILQGAVGAAILQIDPASYFNLAVVIARNNKNKQAPEISAILSQVRDKILGEGNAPIPVNQSSGRETSPKRELLQEG